MYSRSRHRKQKKSLPLAFFSLLILVGAIFFFWNAFYSPEGIQKRTDIVVEGNATPAFRLGGSEMFMESDAVIDLIEGEAVQSRRSTGTYLVFFEGTKVFLDQNTEVFLTRVREREGDQSANIELSIPSGRVWVEVPRKINPESLITLRSGDVFFITRGEEKTAISFSKDHIAVDSGKGDLVVGSFSKTLELGQEISFSSQDLISLQNGGSGPQKSIISSEFQKSEWFQSHSQNEDLVIDGDEDIDVELDEKEEGTIGIKILTPGKNDDEVTVVEDTVQISGTVPDNIERVIVNDYALSKFEEGDTTFSYNASVQYDSLEEGRNEYEIVALEVDGEERYEARITLIYDPDGELSEEDSASEEEDVAEEEATNENSDAEDEDAEEETTSVTGELSITSPQEGESIADDIIVVEGTAASNASDIVVNGYTLTQFSAGDKTWLYRISSAIGNREEGEIEVEVEMLDEDGEILDTETLTFIAEPLPEPEVEEDVAQPEGDETDSQDETQEEDETPPSSGASSATGTSASFPSTTEDDETETGVDEEPTI